MALKSRRCVDTGAYAHRKDDMNVLGTCPKEDGLRYVSQ